MRYPNVSQENKLRKKGYKQIAGLDEAGRGSWAGPIVAAAVILNPEKKITGIKDSKLLSSKKREFLYTKITKNAHTWSYSIVSEKIIDDIGIARANLLAMEKAVKKLSLKPDHLLIDYIKLDINIPSISILEGDKKITSIAAASIVAKVTRDRLLISYHKNYPDYKFHNHKGYGTSEHFKMIIKHGPCKIHRNSFEPIRSLTSDRKIKYN